jgi:hypothetical protein
MGEKGGVGMSIAVGQRVKIVGLNSIGDPTFLGRVGVVERTRDGMHLVQVPGLGADEFYPNELRLVRDLPLLYSAPMVLACLAGLKTQTRRIPPRKLWGDVDAVLAWGRARYGEPGDVLYVREAWRTAVALDEHSPRRIGEMAVEAGYEPWAPLRFEADLRMRGEDVLHSFGGAWGKRPGIHMPKWASRIRRRRTEPLRVERVQDISEADALAEGVKPSDAAVVYRGTVRQPDMEMTARGAFLCLWDDINGARGPVAENPPVIVVSHEARQAEEARAA